MKPEKTDRFRTVEDRMSRLAETSAKETPDPEPTEAPAREPAERTSDAAPEDEVRNQ